jgi:asparagine synthase (glutamine-hydrolysing)
MDMPSCDGVNTWFISKYAASKGLKAVLSGLGGDELFGGYPSFNRMELSILLQNLPGFLKTIGKNSLSKRLNRMSYLKLDGVKGLYLFLRGHFTPNEIAKQLGAYEKDIWKILDQSPTFIDLEELDDKNMASWIEFNMYMQNQLLRDSDVMSMIHGVEIRVPFLDDQIIRLANSVSPDLKYSGERPKQFLIDTFYDDLPRGIWDRPKMGFSFPFSKWLASSKYVYDLMNDGDSISINNFNKFKEGKLHWSHMMSLIILKYRKAI